jgi:hypothetical protein
LVRGRRTAEPQRGLRRIPPANLCASAALRLTLLLSVACSNPAKREAASLVAAIDRYRRAENVAKPAAAQAVYAAACSDVEVCETKEACVAAIQPTVRALELKDEVAGRVDELEKGTLAPDDPVATKLRGQLDEAKELLGRGREAMGPCEQKVLVLRMKYGV